MSHFAMLVLVKDDEATRENIDQQLAVIMEPFSENKEVAEYDDDCSCVGFAARVDARRAADADFAKAHGIELKSERPMDDIRKWFHDSNADVSEDERESRWKDQVANPLTELQHGYETRHAMYNKPDPACEECHGSGKVKSNYNPNSKWDWYEIGGRWTGSLDGYDPEKDPDNIENCPICNGTGMRNDEFGRQERSKDPAYTCNGCDGKGKRLKWPTAWKRHPGDIAKIEDVPATFIPFGVLTPDGEWIERGQMGWWAIVSDEKDDDKWAAEYRGIMAKYQGHIAVLVDCHI